MVSYNPINSNFPLHLYNILFTLHTINLCVNLLTGSAPYISDRANIHISVATHLGHELHQDCSMDYDSKCKRGRFIENSTAIRETFKFANPEQILKSIQVHCFDMYGSMLWDIFGQEAAQYYRCWGTCVKLCWDLPRSTHTYFVENLLAKDFKSIRQQVFARYIGFYQSLVKSPSKEVAVISRIVGQDAASTTGNNLLSLRI